MITYQKTLTVTIDCSVLNEEKIVDALGMVKGVLKVDPYLSNGEKVWKVYKLVSKKDPTAVYIGNTRARLSQRLGGHIHETKLYPESDKSKWLNDNQGYVEILPLAIADSEDDILSLEEEQMIKYVKLGYNVLNRKYPKTGKPYSGKHTTWKDSWNYGSENLRRIFECIEHWTKTKDSFPTHDDIRREISDIPVPEIGKALINLCRRGLLKQDGKWPSYFYIPANAFVMEEEP